MSRVLLTQLASYRTDGDQDLVRQLEVLSEEQWGVLLQHASLHRVLPNLVRLGRLTNQLPPATDATVRELHTGFTNEAHARLAGYSAVMDALGNSDITALALKGFVLATQCYPAPTLRLFNDLDLLVPEEQLDVAADVLFGLGFTQSEITTGSTELEPIDSLRIQGYRQELQHLAEFVKRDSATGMLLKVDLHFRLSTVFDHMAPNASVAIRRSYVYDQDKGYRTLAPADFIAHLAYHSWWDTQSVENVSKLRDLRLYQFADIALAMDRWDLTCSMVLESAGELGVAQTAHWALSVTQHLFGALRQTEVLDPNEALRVDAHLADRWIQRDTSVPFTNWTSPAWERMFDTTRAERVSMMFIREYIAEHTHRGDILQWITRSDPAQR